MNATIKSILQFLGFLAVLFTAGSIDSIADLIFGALGM